MEKFYVTTPIYYPSGRFHIGTAYTTVLADSMKRYQKLKGKDVYMLTGTDEHGQKIEEKAKEQEKTPQEYVDKMASDAKKLWEIMKIDYDDFIRTTEKRHVDIVQKIFDRLWNKVIFIRGNMKDGIVYHVKAISQKHISRWKMSDCGREVKLMKEEAYFFNMKKYADRLLKYYEEHPDFIKPEFRKNEMINIF